MLYLTKRRKTFMKNILCLLSLMAAIGIVASGCTSTEQGVVGGAAGGAALGGIIGHQSGETGEGAAIGALGGAVLGGLIGHSQEKRSHEPDHHIQLCPQGHEVDVTGFGPGALVRCPIDNNTFTVQ